MTDYDNDFEIEEEVEGEEPTKNDSKNKITTEKPTIKTLSRNNSREIPLSTRKVQPLGNHNSNHSEDFKKNYTPSTQTFQSQDYSSKPKLKPFGIKGSDSNSNIETNSISDLKKQESSDALNTKPFTKPFKIQKRYDDDSNTSNTFDDDNKYYVSKPIGSKKHKYNFDDESFSQPRDSVSKPPRNTKSGMNSIQMDNPNNYEQVVNLINSFPAEKNDREFEDENKQLRRKLKEMNALLTNIIARQDLSKLVPKKLTFKEKSVEDRLRTYNSEIQNNQKTLAIKQEEYQKLKERIDKVKDPAFIVKLDEKIKKTNEKIEQVRKENKQLEWQSQNSGKNLSNIENEAGLPEALITANERAREAAVLQKKNEKMRAEAENFEQQQEQQLKRIEELSYKVQKLEELARHHNLSLEKNPHQQKYGEISKEVKDYEEGIKILLNRNDKYMENFFEHELEELRTANERDKAHLASLDDMIHKQITALKDMLAKESANGDRGMRDLFSKLQGSLEEKKATVGDEEKPLSEKEVKKVSKKPPLPKQLNEREELYKDLPLFSPKRENPKQLTKKGPRTRSTGKKSRSPDEKERMMEEINELYLKQEKEQKEKADGKSNEKPKKPNLKPKSQVEEPNKEGQKREEEQAVEKAEPDQTKPNAVEEKKPFSKPFGLKKGGNKLGNTSAINESPESSEKKDESQKTRETIEEKANVDFSKPLFIDKKDTESVGNKFKNTPDLNYVAGGVSRLNNQNNQSLKLPDFDSGKKKEEPTSNSGSKLTYNSGLTLGGVQSQEQKNTTQTQSQAQEELPTEDFGFGASRINRNRVMKKDDNKEELILNFNGGSKLQNNQTNSSGALKLNDSTSTDKKDSKIFSLTQKNPADSEIKDPFAKYDDISNLDFAKKKNLGLDGAAGKKLDDENNKFSFGEKKSEGLSEKREEPKPFTLNTQQPGPKRIFNPEPIFQQNQPLTLNPQPLNLSQNNQPQLRFGGDQGNSAWNNSKNDDKEIRTIGEANEKKGEGLNFSSNNNIGSVWDKKDKDNDLGFKLGGRDKKDTEIAGVLKMDEGKSKPSIWDKKESDTGTGLKLGGANSGSIWDKKEKENTGDLKIGGGGASIWDKKEQSIGIKETGQDQPKDVSKLNFNEKKKDNEDGLSFLNEKPNNADKRENDLNIGDDTKKPRRMKMGDNKNEQKKNILADEIQGNDFFNDLDI